MATAPSPAGAPLQSPTAAERDYRLPLAVLTSLFFMWGFLTCLNDILIPHLKAAFSLNYLQVSLVQFCFFAAYFLVSLPSGAIVRRMGYQRGIVIGLVTAGVGCLLFYPAAGTRSYPVFLGALFVLASGITLLQVAANPYVAILGPAHSASARLNLTQAFNSLGTTVAPLFGSVLILAAAAKSEAELAALSAADLAAYRAGEASSVQVPYLGLAGVLVLIAVVMGVLKLPAIQGGDTESTGGGEAVQTSAWRYPHLVLGALGIFLYVGAEVSIGSFLVNFMKQPDIAGYPEAAGSKMLIFFWGGAMVGRFIGSAILARFSAGKLLAANALCAAGLAVATTFLSGHAAMYSILAVGLFNSIMFPTIFTLGVRGLGRHTEEGSGILCMAIVGGAIVPLAMGWLADRIGLHQAFLLPAICYLYIAYYGLKGSRAGASGSRREGSES